MEDDNAIEVAHVRKSFKLPHEKQSSIKGLFLHFFQRKKGYEKQLVLDDVSFEIKRGEFFGIVGRNGSGKSTLLKLLAEIYTPNEGTVRINGKLTPFIELGVGFNPELTGRENVYLNGALLGFSHKEVDEMYDDIVSFAEIERFMDQKLKNYSSGMQVRLAFSIAIRADTDILLLDEVLAVGDAIFQKKCFNYFKELKRRKKTVVFVSHDANALEEYCDRGVLIEKGKVVTMGKINRVVRDYLDLLNDQEEKAGLNKPTTQNRWGQGDVKVAKIETFNAETSSRQLLFTEDQSSIGVRVTYKATVEDPSPVYGITVTDMGGQRIFESNTKWSKVLTEPIVPGRSVTVEWQVPNVFNSGDFQISPAAADRTGSTIYDWWDAAATFKVRKKLQSAALTNLAHPLSIKQDPLTHGR